MKRRIKTYVAGACVAGLMAGVPNAALAGSSATDGGADAEGAVVTISEGEFTSSSNMVVALYGPPSVFEERTPLLYGPPSAFEGDSTDGEAGNVSSDGQDDSTATDGQSEGAAADGQSEGTEEGTAGESSNEIVAVVGGPVQALYGPPPIVLKRDNSMVVRTTNKVVKASKLTAKKKVLRKAIKVKNAVGTVVFTRMKKGSSKSLKVGKKSGAVTVAKGTKAGKYAIRVKVKAAGNSRYAPATKIVTVKVRVK